MEASEILKECNLKCTDCRSGILDALIHSGVALSENEIKAAQNDSYDRTTFYRSFKTLLEHGVLHKITIDTEVKYILSKDKDAKPENHYHFYCLYCGKVFCMHSIPDQLLKLPKDFTSEFTDLIVKGCCASCNKTK